MLMMKNLAWGAAFIALGALSTQAARLPIGFDELEYIESTGTQYIDTGVTSDEHALADYKTQTDTAFLSYGSVENQGGAGFTIIVR